MKLGHISQARLKRLIKEVFARHLPKEEYRLFFFGSRVKGSSFPRSDIDLGFEGEGAIPAAIKLEIEEELQNLPTLYKIDLVDFKDVSESFKKTALKKVEPIN